MKCKIIKRHADRHVGTLGLLLEFVCSARERDAVNAAIGRALLGPPLVLGAQYQDGRWWVPEGTDLSGIFDNWKEVAG